MGAMGAEAQSPYGSIALSVYPQFVHLCGVGARMCVCGMCSMWGRGSAPSPVASPSADGDKTSR